MAERAVRFDFLARDRASGTFDRLARKTSMLSGSMSLMGSGLMAVGAMAGTAFAAVGAATAAAVTAGAAVGVKTAASLEQSQIAFETLLGSASKAKTFLADLTSFANRTPFRLDGVVTASRKLLGVGVAAEDVIPMLTRFGDTAGALGLSQDQFSRMMLAISQMIGKGKVMSQEMLQLAEAGVPAWMMMSKATGKSVADLQGLAQNGKLLTADVLPKLLAQMNKDYGGAMGKQALTLSGLWSTFMDTLTIGLARAIQPLMPMLKQSLGGAIAALTPAVDVIAGAMTALAPVLSSVGDAVRANLAPAFATLRDLWTQLFGPAEQADKVMRVQGETLSTFGQTAQSVARFVSMLADEGRKLGAWFATEVLPRMQAVAEHARSAFAPVFERLPGIISTVGAALRDNVMPALRSLIEHLARGYEQARPMIDVMGRIAAMLAAVLGPVIRDFSGPVLGVMIRTLGFAFEMFMRLVGGIGNVLNAMLNLRQTALGLRSSIANAVGDLGSLLWGAGRSVVEGLINGIASMGTRLRDFIVGFLRRFLPGPVVEFLGISSPSRLFAGIGAQIPAGLVAGIASGGRSVADAMLGLVAPPAVPAFAEAAARGPLLAGATSVPSAASIQVTVYPRERQSEEAIGRAVARELAWQSGGR